MTPRRELSLALTSLLREHLSKSGRYHLQGFGIWTLRVRPSRRIRNPATKALMQLPASLEIRFRACKRLKAKVFRGTTAKPEAA